MNTDTNNINGKIVFHSTGFDNPINIFTVDANGNTVRQLTDSPVRVWNFSPAVSPDGQMIVFNSARNGSDEIYILVQTAKR
jgi:Tol biopolymer transport system component